MFNFATNTGGYIINFLCKKSRCVYNADSKTTTKNDAEYCDDENENTADALDVRERQCERESRKAYCVTSHSSSMSRRMLAIL